MSQPLLSQPLLAWRLRAWERTSRAALWSCTVKYNSLCMMKDTELWPCYPITVELWPQHLQAVHQGQHIAYKTPNVESAVWCCNSRLIYKFNIKQNASNNEFYNFSSSVSSSWTRDVFSKFETTQNWILLVTCLNHSCGSLVVWPGMLFPNSRGNKAAANLRL